MKLTLEFVEPPKLPLHVGSRLESTFGFTGRDAVLFILGVNIFVSDNDLDIEGFSRGWLPSGTWLATFSISVLEFRYLKLSFGKIPFKVDLPLDVDGPGEPLVLASAEEAVKRKLTLLGVGVGLGVGGIFIMTESCEESSAVREGILMENLY